MILRDRVVARARASRQGNPDLGLVGKSLPTLVEHLSICTESELLYSGQEHILSALAEQHLGSTPQTVQPI